MDDGRQEHGGDVLREEPASVWDVARRILPLLWLALCAVASSRILVAQIAVDGRIDPVSVFFAGMIGLPLGACVGMVLHWAWGALWHGLRHRLVGHRFVCPSCLRFGPFRVACASCGREFDTLHAHTSGAYDFWGEDWAHPQCRPGRWRRRIAAYCGPCEGRHDRRLYHERRVRVLGVLSAAYAATPGTRQDANGVRHRCHDDGAWLTYAVDLGALPVGEHRLPGTHVLRAVQDIWLDPRQMDALALGQAVDRFLRLAGHGQAAKCPVAVHHCGPLRDPAARNLLESRFEALVEGESLPAWLDAPVIEAPAADAKGPAPRAKAPGRWAAPAVTEPPALAADDVSPPHADAPSDAPAPRPRLSA